MSMTVKELKLGLDLISDDSLEAHVDLLGGGRSGPIKYITLEQIGEENTKVYLCGVSDNP